MLVADVKCDEENYPFFMCHYLGNLNFGPGLYKGSFIDSFENKVFSLKILTNQSTFITIGELPI